jgi:DNA repair protein RadC
VTAPRRRTSTAQASIPLAYIAARYRLSLVREAAAEYGEPVAMERPESVARWLWETVYHDAPQEMLTAVYLDARNRLIGYSVLYIGTVSRINVEPRAILTSALLCNASGVCIAHNHPSGDPTPSAEDLLFSRRLAAAGEVVGVVLVDSLIVADGGRWVSLRERGAW